MGISKLRQIRQGKAAPEAPKSQTCREWIDRFVNYLRTECHLAENSVAAYRRDLERFAIWMKAKPIQGLKIADLTDYVGWLGKQSLATSSVSRHVVSTRMFFKFLQLEGAIVDNPAELIATQKMWQRVPHVLTIGAVDRFLRAPQAYDAHGLRDRAILELLYATGCRVSEVSRMLVANVRFPKASACAKVKVASREWCRSENVHLRPWTFTCVKFDLCSARDGVYKKSLG